MKLPAVPLSGIRLRIKELKLRIKAFIFLLFTFYFLLFTFPAYAGTTPPSTTHTFSGTLGGNDWYTSTLDVVLKASDLESGPKSTTYWLNDNLPLTEVYTTEQNQIINPSFERGSWFFGTINNWSKSGPAIFWQTRTPAFVKFGYCAAALMLFESEFAYWHNRDDAVLTEGLKSYSVSAWIKTLDIVGLGAYFEVWTKAANPANDQLLVTSEKVTGTTDWRLLTADFIMPQGFEGVYLKLGAKEDSLVGMTFWDGVSMYGGYTAMTDFTVVENGNHVLHYYSKDNNGNVETENQVSLKIDTKAPSNWQNFSYIRGSNDHSYFSSIEVIDVTSGIDVSTAFYRFYTNHQDIGWSDWLPVASVKRVSNGQAAADGETGFVEMTTPEIDFGDSATVMRVQFQIADVAGNSSNSPIQTIEGPWLKVEKQDLYAGAKIEMVAAAPLGEYNSDSTITSATSISNFTSSTGWLVGDYNHRLSGKTSIADYGLFIEDYRSQALPLPDGKLPTSSGVYKYSGSYVIDHNSTPAGFEGNEISAIVIFEGDLRIKTSFSLHKNSAVLFLAEGNIEVEGNVEEIAGFFVCEGIFDTNIDHKQNKQLKIYGGAVVGGGFVLGRDLGRKGNLKNSEDPAEWFTFPLQYFLNSEFLGLIAGGETAYKWREIGP